MPAIISTRESTRRTSGAAMLKALASTLRHVCRAGSAGRGTPPALSTGPHARCPSPTRDKVSGRVAGALLALALVGCGGSSADQLLETAELEELQHNPTHARELYQDVLRRHAGTPQAEKAAARLRALGAP